MVGPREEERGRAVGKDEFLMHWIYVQSIAVLLVTVTVRSSPASRESGKDNEVAFAAAVYSTPSTVMTSESSRAPENSKRPVKLALDVIA